MSLKQAKVEALPFNLTDKFFILVTAQNHKDEKINPSDVLQLKKKKQQNFI